MCRIKLLIFLFFLSKVSSYHLCNTKNITDQASGITSTKENLCKTHPCLYRYCNLPDSLLVIWRNGTQKCIAMEKVANITEKALNLTSLNVGHTYKSYNGNLQLSKKGFRDFRNVYLQNRKVYSKNCSGSWKSFMTLGKFLEDGSYRYNIANAKVKFVSLDAGSFIVEYILFETKKGWPSQPYLAVKFIKDLEDTNDRNILFFNGIGMLISCFFLLLVILVYSIFKELRNLSGMTVMAYAASFTLAYLDNAVQIMISLETGRTTHCKYTTFFYYFGFMASFFWMNVLSFDIWWTFRGTIKLRSINRRGILHKFLMYCLYAFGIPLILTIIAYIMDNVDLGDSDVITPRFDACFYGGDDYMIMFLYIHVPMLILLAANTILFLMTCYNIWWLRRDIQRTYSKDSICKNQSRFLLYLRLFMITGISWILEAVSARVDYPIVMQYIINGYNALIGVFIFINFVCNRKVLNLIRKRYPKADEYISALQSTVFQKSSTKNKNMSRKMDDTTSEAIRTYPEARRS